MRWLEIIIYTHKESTEAIAAKLLALGAGGVSLEESWLWEQAKKDSVDALFPSKMPGTYKMILLFYGVISPFLFYERRWPSWRSF